MHYSQPHFSAIFNGTDAVLDAQVCRHFGQKLLRERTVWPVSDFIARWHTDVPEVHP